MLDRNQATQVLGRDAYDTHGDKIGSIGQLYLDDTTKQPAWITVNTGFFGTHESFVPIQQAEMRDETVVVPFDKQTVKDSPSVDADDHISRDDERRLYEYYGLDYQAARTPGRESAGVPPTAGTTGAPSRREPASGRDEAEMVRSEERLHAGTTEEETGRARLRKYVVTEHETMTVPVEKERAVLEREPVDESDRTTSPGRIGDEEREVTLHEERPHVSKTAEPVEKVRLETEDVQSRETVSGDVRKERIEAEGDIDERR